MSNLLLFPELKLEPDEAATREEHALSTPVPDEAERTRALDTASSWIVEAPAGSGKTGLLMQRYLKLLASDSVTHPEEVLAITFTRKATAELRARVLEQLEEAQAAMPLGDDTPHFRRATREYALQVLARDRALGWALLDDPNQLRIRTIDSVCGEIARTLPLLSGSGGIGSPVDDARPLYRLAARRTVMQLGGPDRVLHDALHTILLHRDGNLGNVESLLATMLAQREQWAELVPLDRASLSEEVLDRVIRPRLEANLERVVCAGLTQALSSIPSDVLHELALFAQRIAGSADHPADSAIAVCASRSLPPEAIALHLEHWVALIHLLLVKDGAPRKSFPSNSLTFTLSKPEQAQLRAIISHLPADDRLAALHAVRALPPARYPEHQWNVAKALFRLLLHALAELKLLFAERHECDFSEMSLAARAALHEAGGAADLSSSDGRTLRHLLVDEMQDTSSAQYDLLELLTHSWDGHSQTVFLVGDPKQSIYIFRQARVERFLRTVREQRLGDVPLGALQLTANFRSKSELVEQYNHDFAKLFPSPAELHGENVEEDVPFVAASAIRGSSNKQGVTWHAAVLNGKGAEARRKRALGEALEIRRVVEDWRARPLPESRKEPWRIAILARARHHLAPTLAEFQSSANGHPIPFRAVDVEQLGERQEVLDAFALTRALLHPSDRTAWLATLRAPWCGLAAADLLALTGEGASSTAEQARAVTIPWCIRYRTPFLSAEGQRLLQRVAPILFTAQEQAGRLILPQLVERTWLSLAGDVSLRADQRANVQRYFALLRKVLATGDHLNLQMLSDSLKELYAEPGSDPLAVEMMTIHKAKGLEWDVVVVPALERQGQVSRYELLNWLELDSARDDGGTVLLAPIAETGDSPNKLSKWIRDTRSRREEAERKRLLYVACTRAREELHLFGACERKKGGELTPGTGTLLQSFWPAAAPEFAPFTQTWIGEKPENGAADQPEAPSADEEIFAIAASADDDPPRRSFPLLTRLPPHFHLRKRFAEAAGTRLSHPVPPTAASISFERPEGSFAIRAFGNTVHRFLELIAKRLAEGSSVAELQQQLPSWKGRLEAALFSEGLPPALCAREALRASGMLASALADPVGSWILTPHPGASSEAALTLASESGAATMRVDRTFRAGPQPLSLGDNTLWIVDFKTTEQGSRTPTRFEEEERAKYGPQLASYATLLRATQQQTHSIMLGLYYPAVPRLICWPDEAPF